MIGLDDETLKSIDQQLEHDFASVRAKMKEVIAKLPKFITLKQAQEQINNFHGKQKHTR